MKKVYFFSTSRIPLDWFDTFSNFEKINPDEIYILSNTEVYIEDIWGKLFDLLQPWLESKNKQAIIITPNLDNTFIRPNIKTERSYSMIESVVPLYQNKNYERLKANKIFSAYMYRASEPRARLLDTIIKENITSEGYITYHQPETKAYDKFKYWNKDPIRFQEESYSKDNINHFLEPYLYRNSFIDIVTETSYESNNFFLTEKTIRPIFHKKPFIVVGPINFHKRYLNEFFRLELYDEIIDYSFDEETCLQCRINGIIDNIKTIISNKDKLQKVYDKLLPKMQHNKKILENIYKDTHKIVPKSLHHLLNKFFNFELYGAIDTSFVQTILNYRKQNG
jgi:hypothetical protein